MGVCTPEVKDLSWIARRTQRFSKGAGALAAHEVLVAHETLGVHKELGAEKRK